MVRTRDRGLTGECAEDEGEALRARGRCRDLAQGAVDGTRFGHADLGIVEAHRRAAASMGVEIAEEAAVPPPAPLIKGTGRASEEEPARRSQSADPRFPLPTHSKGSTLC